MRVDGTAAADRPYSVSERNYTIEALQPQGPNQYGVFFVHPRETVDFRYERQLYSGGRRHDRGDRARRPARPRGGRPAGEPRAHAVRRPSTEMSCRAPA